MAFRRLLVSSTVPLLFALGLGACTAPDEPGQQAADTASASAADKLSGSQDAANPTRNAYFGELHVHTRYSFDAFAFGTVATPDDSYAFAKGEPLQHPAGFEMKLDRPLDFQGVTDHGMYLGMLPAMTEPGSPAFEHPMAPQMRSVETVDDRRSMFVDMMPYLAGADGTRQYLDQSVVESAWADIVAAANRHNDPGRFTTFIAYEYTSAGGVRDNLHRNVIFRGDKAPLAPFSRMDSPNPEDLWAKMDDWRDAGMDSIAIPHNSNGSGGRMFQRTYYEGAPIDPAYVQTRMRNEPIVEVTQVKGTSETHPGLSPNDEWAGFEIMPYKIATNIISAVEGSYVRDAYRRGLELAESGAGNPYKFGLIGASDSHTGAGAFEEDNYWSKVGLLDAEPNLRGSVPGGGGNAGVSVADGEAEAPATIRTQDGSGRTYRDTYYHTWGASGLAGVWAEENTREALFDAMRRKETFATTGPRIRMRFFAGPELSGLDMTDPSFLSAAYERGVPMGGDLYGSTESPAPTFMVWALRDPLEAPLQRVQIVKGWVTPDGTTEEKVFDVVCSDGLEVDPVTGRCPDNGAGVDLQTCKITDGVGADELKAAWQDPEFQADQSAFYYVRVLQNPTCRWSTWDSIREGVEPRYDVAPAIQERAWSSPIWYAPA